MKSLILLTTIFLNIAFSFGQEQREFILVGKVYDGSGKEKVPIPNVKIKIGKQVLGTNRNGEFQVKIHYKSGLLVLFSHVGFKSYSQRLTDKIVKRKIIGVTCHGSKDLALKAQKNNADYIAFGSFYKSRLKPAAKKANIKILSWAKRKIKKPIVVIGGITDKNYKKLIIAGANYIAISTYIWNNPTLKPQIAIKKFK